MLENHKLRCDECDVFCVHNLMAVKESTAEEDTRLSQSSMQLPVEPQSL
jgi:hypothetical protein